MNIYTDYPLFQNFIKNEVDTLEYLATRDCLKYYNDLNEAIYLAHLEYKSSLKRHSLKHFEFHAKFMLEIEGELHFVFIGANVKENFDECSYFLAMADNKNDKQLIRKFHFDYADKGKPTSQNVPHFHLQYGGKMSPKMQEDGLDDTKLDHWLSLPRLNFYPINLALLMDLMLCEFRTEVTNKIVQSSEWRDLIYKNENFIIKSYFNNINNYVHSHAYNKNRLLRDFCYGE